ncbi:5' nucleotidase, NT5C type [Desulfolithobacter sp.]
MVSGTIDPARLGFDFDGVVADTAEAFLRLACEEYGRCDIRLEDITSFEVEECLAMDPSAIQAIFMKILQDSVGIGLKPMPGSVEVLGELSETAPLTLVTARPQPEPVREWLATILPPSTLPRIHIIAMGAHDDKPRHIKGRGLEWFIDDRAETCLQLPKYGITPIVFSQPWNKGKHQLSTVSSWEEIRSLCLP